MVALGCRELKGETGIPVTESRARTVEVRDWLGVSDGAKSRRDSGLFDRAETVRVRVRQHTTSSDPNTNEAWIES
jgi:hypothetical protein